MAGDPGGYFLFRITIDGVDVVTRKFRALEGMIEDLSPAWEQVGDELRADFALNMLSEGSRYGGWAPLAPSTVREKARNWPGAPMEWRTGMLGRSLAEQGAAGNISEVQKMSARFGTSVPYASFQHYGTRKMPARALIGLSWYTQRNVVQVVGDYIREQIREVGLE